MRKKKEKVKSHENVVYTMLFCQRHCGKYLNAIYTVYDIFIYVGSIKEISIEPTANKEKSSLKKSLIGFMYSLYEQLGAKGKRTISFYRFKIHAKKQLRRLDSCFSFFFINVNNISQTRISNKKSHTLLTVIKFIYPFCLSL